MNENEGIELIGDPEIAATGSWKMTGEIIIGETESTMELVSGIENGGQSHSISKEGITGRAISPSWSHSGAGLSSML